MGRGRDKGDLKGETEGRARRKIGVDKEEKKREGEAEWKKTWDGG